MKLLHAIVDGKTYTCPMHPEVQRERAGLCPECGMQLIRSQIATIKSQQLDKRDYDKHAGHSVNIFKAKFWVSFVLTIPVVLISSPVRVVRPEAFPQGEYLSFVLSSIVFFYGGWIFLASAWRELRARLPGMMTLIALAITTAYLWSIFAVFRGAEALFWELTTLITVMLLGHWIEMRAVTGAQGALRELSKLLPDTAELVGESDKRHATRIVPLSELKVRDRVLVRPGGRIPADGIVREGRSDVNESLLTGESKPVSKVEGASVVAGSINGDGSLTIEVGKIGSETFLAGVMRLVEEAQASKSRLQLLSDRAAFYLTLIAVFGGAATLFSWFALGKPAAFAVERLVAVLVIACPHALGLAIPLVASISTTLAARRGFLVRSRIALEAARKIDVVLFDKTGTLTKGEYGIARIIADQNAGARGFREDEILKLAASVDKLSEHFAARAIVEEAMRRKLELLPVIRFERVPGRGVRAVVQGKSVAVGGEAILEEAGATVPEAVEREASRLSSEGKTIIYVLLDGTVAGALALGDVIREESREAIQRLKSLGVRVAMVTGDSPDVADWVAKELRIDEYFARVLPGEKAEKVKELQIRGLKVAMVGDGVNDAPALTQADVGIAIGAGTNVAIESAGIILVKNDPRDIPRLVALSRLTYRKMIQNLFWATGYNVVALPLAAGVLFAQGIVLNPAASAFLMSLSTVIVAANAVTLRRAKL